MMHLYSMALMLAAAAPTTPAPAPVGFCARIAPGLGLSPRRDPAGDYWQVNTLNPAQRLLIGGSAMMSFGAAPLSYGEAEARRAADMCAVRGKALVCDVVGPVRITASAKGEPVTAEARPGERARLWTAGTRVRCRDLPPG